MKYEIKVSRAAELLGVSESRVSQLVAQRVLDSVTINGKRRISLESIEHYRTAVRTTGRPPKAARPTTTAFTLMCADYEVMRLLHDSADDEPFTCKEVLDPARAPWGCVTRGGQPKRREFNAWWRMRSVPASRPGIERRIAQLGVPDVAELPLRSLGLSLSDCYWVRPDSAAKTLKWADINYFNNWFDEGSQGDWDWWLSAVGLRSPDNTSEGELPKKWVVLDDARVLLKGCRHDDQRPYNEVVATLLFRLLLQPGDYVEYYKKTTEQGPACACNNFLGDREEFIPANALRKTITNVKGDTNYDRFCRYVGLQGIDEVAYRELMSKMIICDSLLGNADRHWRNFGFIRNIDTLQMRPAPLFDTGNCLWYWKSDREVEVADYTFAARPFGPEPARQLACVDQARWFDEGALDGFCDLAIEILSESKHASKPGRLDYIAKGIQNRMAEVLPVMRVLAYK